MAMQTYDEFFEEQRKIKNEDQKEILERLNVLMEKMKDLKEILGIIEEKTDNIEKKLA